MNYREALQFLHDRSDYDRGFISDPFAGDEAAALGILRTRALLDGLGSPDQRYPIIHVAGTKGKGSTCAMIEALLRAGGRHTGMYVTPHLHTIRERIQVNGQPVSEEQFAAAARRASEAVNEIEAARPELGRLTAFEIGTAMALDAFAGAAVDDVVLEVGLGGRLDATNAVESTVSVITPISFDHTAILGETLAEIAAEKAGIIEPDQPIVVGEQPAEALEEIERIAATHEAMVFQAGADWQVVYVNGKATLSGFWGVYADIQLGLAGRHQAENAGMALFATWLIQPAIAENEATVREGLTGVRWPARFEIVGTEPPIVIDGAHNTSSARRLVDTLIERFPDSSFVVVLGTYRDKDVPGILAELARLDPKLIVTRSPSPRALDPATLLDAARKSGFPAEDAPAVSGAIERARALAGPGDVICVAGSLSVAAGAREALALVSTPDDERVIFRG